MQRWVFIISAKVLCCVKICAFVLFSDISVACSALYNIRHVHGGACTMSELYEMAGLLKVLK